MNAEADRDFSVNSDQCIIIPNSVPLEAKKAIDKDPSVVAWKKPFTIKWDSET